MRRASALVALLACACGPAFLPGDLIQATQTRIVGTRVDVVTDPGRASAQPGESVSIRYLVVTGMPMSDALRVASVSCEQADSAGINGLTGCAGATFGAASADVAPSADPTLTMPLTIPSGLVPDLSTSVLTYLGVCADGSSPVLDATAATVTCGDRHGDIYQSTLRVSPDARLTNHNPTLDDETYMLDDAAWTAPDRTVPATGCAAMAGGAALPLVIDTHVPTLHFGCSPDDRESYPAYDADMHPITAREDLDISHFVTAGTIDGSTRITGDDTNDMATTTWTPPGDAPMDGELVRFWFVAHDRRGGSDWVERDLCVVPPAGDGGTTPSGHHRGCGCTIVGAREGGGAAALAILAACVVIVRLSSIRKDRTPRRRARAASSRRGTRCSRS